MLPIVSTFMVVASIFFLFFWFFIFRKSSDITNRADNVFKVERVPEEREQELGYSSLLTILKNREFGARARIKLEYNEPSRRLYEAGGRPIKCYSWEEARKRGQSL